MLKEVEKTVWEKEFSKYKAIRMREEFRVAYDRVQMALEVLKDPQTDEQKKDKEANEANLGLLKQQLVAIDDRIAGMPASTENPEGVVGITQEIDGFVQLRDNIRAHIKNNC